MTRFRFSGGRALDHVEGGHHGHRDAGDRRVGVAGLERVDRRLGPWDADMRLDPIDDGSGRQRGSGDAAEGAVAAIDERGGECQDAQWSSTRSEPSFDHPVSEAPAIVEADAGSDGAQKDRREDADEIAQPPPDPAAERSCPGSQAAGSPESPHTGQFLTGFRHRCRQMAPSLAAPRRFRKAARPLARERGACKSCAKPLTFRVMSVLNGRANYLAGPFR